MFLMMVYAVKIGRKYVFLDNFGVVEEGVLYRSGQLKPYQLRRVIRERRIKTVINTREAAAPANLMAEERRVCYEEGVDVVRLTMPGDGCGTYEQYDKAIEILSDSNRLPALVHCARGTHRTGALITSYRVVLQDMPIVDAMREMEDYRFKPDGHPLVPHLRKYLEEKSKTP